MNPIMTSFVAACDRGMITQLELVYRIVQETVAKPTDELVMGLPAETVVQIRELAASPRETRWITVGSWCGTQEGWEVAQQESQGRWLAGLALWRDYFGFTAEQST